MDNCIFCQIVRDEKPAYKIYENNNFLAFLDLFPYGPGHTMVIPKAHYRWVWDVPIIGEYMETTQKVAIHLAKTMGTSTSYTFIFGEQVPHAHIHLLPTVQQFTNRLGVAFRGIRQPKLDENTARQLQEKLQFTE